MKTAHDLVTAARARVSEISVAQAEHAIRTACLLVDVREADEFAAGHVPGAVHISRGMLEFRFSSMPALQLRDIQIVLYCKNSAVGLSLYQSHSPGFRLSGDGDCLALPDSLRGNAVPFAWKEAQLEKE